MRKWEDNIRMYFKEMDVITKNWIDSAQGSDYWRVIVNDIEVMELLNDQDNI